MRGGDPLLEFAHLSRQSRADPSTLAAEGAGAVVRDNTIRSQTARLNRTDPTTLSATDTLAGGKQLLNFR